MQNSNSKRKILLTNKQTNKKRSLKANNEAIAARLLFQDDIRTLISAMWSSTSKEMSVGFYYHYEEPAILVAHSQRRYFERADETYSSKKR